jgi:hypothetical protein
MVSDSTSLGEEETGEKRVHGRMVEGWECSVVGIGESWWGWREKIPESPLYVYFPRSSPWVIFRFALGMIWLRVYVPPESCLQVLQWLNHLVSKSPMYVKNSIATYQRMCDC